MHKTRVMNAQNSVMNAQIACNECKKQMNNSTKFPNSLVLSLTDKARRSFPEKKLG